MENLLNNKNFSNNDTKPLVITKLEKPKPFEEKYNNYFNIIDLNLDLNQFKLPLLTIKSLKGQAIIMILYLI